MAVAAEIQQDIYTLYSWLYRLGLWRGDFLKFSSEKDILAAFESQKAQYDLKNIVLGNSGNDADSGALASVASAFSYDEKTGILDLRQVYWRHMPLRNLDPQKPELEDSYTLHIKGLVDHSRSKLDDVNPIILPQEISIGGTDVFLGPSNAGHDDPYGREERLKIDRIIETVQRVHEMLHNKEPISNFAKILHGGNVAFNYLKAGAGASPFIMGQSVKGGWDVLENQITSKYNEYAHKDGEKLRFTIGDVQGFESLSAKERLAIVMGFNQNTIEPYQALKNKQPKHSNDNQSGVSYDAFPSFDYDKKSGRMIFKISIIPDQAPENVDLPEPFDVARIEFSQEHENVFVLEKAQFMDGLADQFRDMSKATNLVNFIQDCNADFSKRVYPDFGSHLARHRLRDMIDEYSPPPSFEKDGGEGLWTPTNGTSRDKKVEFYGSAIGGGNVFSARALIEDKNNPDHHRLSEVHIIHDFPLAVGGSESEYHASNPNFDRFMNDVDDVVIVLSHDHFDHASLEYYAKLGKLKGKKILCNGAVAKIVRHRLETLEVAKEQYPFFIEYDKEVDVSEGVIELEKDHYAYAVKDGDGNKRAWIQICKNGAHHSAQVDSHIITFCKNDELYGDSYFIEGDSFGTSEKGWRFMERGQLALADHKDKTGVSIDKLKARRMGYHRAKEKYQTQISQDKMLAVGQAVISGASADEIAVLKKEYEALYDNFYWDVTTEDKLYVSLEETTGLTSGGYAPTQEEIKFNVKEVYKSIPTGLAVVAVPFSTNVKDISIRREIWAEEDTLRNTTAVGGNAEFRDTVFNEFGVDGDVDLRSLDIGYDKVPEDFYKAVLDGIEKEIKELSERYGDDVVKHYTYKVLHYIQEQVWVERERGEFQSETLYDYFMSANENAYEDVADILNLEPSDDGLPRAMPPIMKEVAEALINEEFKMQTDEGRWVFKDEYKDSEARLRNVRYFMLSRLYRHGKVKFETRGTVNETNMNHAIDLEQEIASRHAGRTSNTAKNYRDNPGELGIISTGPMGTLEEQFASLSRYARGESLFDYDPQTRPTGYKINEEDFLIEITQPPSMGDKARKAQDALIDKIIANRGNTIIKSFKNGFVIHNPKGHLEHYMNHYRTLGWNPQWDSGSNQVRIYDRPTHIHGHRFYHDMLDKMKDRRFKARNVEVIHNPGDDNFERMLEICDKAGRNLSIQNPDDFRAYQMSYDHKARVPKMEVKNYLTASYFLYKLRRRFGQQYGGKLEAVVARFIRREGTKRIDGLEARADGGGLYNRNTAQILHNDFSLAGQGRGAGVREKTAQPSMAEIQEYGGDPKVPTPGMLI